MKKEYETFEVLHCIVIVVKVAKLSAYCVWVVNVWLSEWENEWKKSDSECERSTGKGFQ